MKTKFLQRVVWLMTPLLMLISVSANANVTDVLTYSGIGFTCNASPNITYTDFSGVNGSNSSAVYAGNVAKFTSSDCKSYLQMRTSSNSGIYTTSSGGTAVSVSVTWHSAPANGRVLKIYGKNSAYSSISELWSDDADTKGAEIGSITKGTSTSVTLTGSYAFIGLRSNDGACMFDNISIEWSTKTVSSIALKTSATKTAYVAGEDFNPAGMVITATYSDASTEDIAYDSHSGDFSFSPSTNLTAGTTSVTVTYATKTCTQSINVYAVTLQALDENGDAIRAGGPAAPTRTGATVTKAANAGNYTFKEWVVTNATLENGANSNQKIITNPTGAVTVTVKYYLPRVVRWLVDGEAWTPYTTTGSGTDGSAECARGSQWKTLTLPTDPAPLSGEGCGQKFVGWTNSEISGMLDKDDDAAAISTLVSSYLLNSENKSSKTNTINAATYTFYAVFADYAE